MEYVTTLYQCGLVFTRVDYNCSRSPQTYHFPIDHEAYSFTVSALGFHPLVTIYTPDGQLVFPCISPLANRAIIVTAFGHFFSVESRCGCVIWFLVSRGGLRRLAEASALRCLCIPSLVQLPLCRIPSRPGTGSTYRPSTIF